MEETPQEVQRCTREGNHHQHFMLERMLNKGSAFSPPPTGWASTS
ncbi:MAG TPA: hypothetical protein VID04_08865 [Methylomirabilota bacterium]